MSKAGSISDICLGILMGLAGAKCITRNVILNWAEYTKIQLLSAFCLLINKEQVAS